MTVKVEPWIHNTFETYYIVIKKNIWLSNCELMLSLVNKNMVSTLVQHYFLQDRPSFPEILSVLDSMVDDGKDNMNK